ncbi:MAG: TlyA family RNA methyltransferase [Verrucomicrobiota bacterium]|nr:TlyA family RNA methyltransferase [Verrucomicrobiota bacterium]
MARIRLDQLVLARGLAESREKAQRLILGGKILSNGRPLTKPGQSIDDSADLRLLEPERYVSRGGEKLEAALNYWKIDLRGAICVDIGASTGGFTDCMLQHGAIRVYAVDVGRALLHPRLAADPRVVVMDEVNARYLTPDMIPESPAFVAIDASFISLTILLPPVRRLLGSGARMVTLIKPQFEVGRAEVGRGGVVRSPSARQRAIERVRAAGEQAGLRWEGVIESPLLGPAGNKEFLAYWTVP